MNEILTVEQIADLLDCEPETVQEKLLNNDLPGVKFGLSWVCPKKTLLDFLHKKSLAGYIRKKAAHLGIQRKISSGETFQIGRRPENIAHHAAKRRAARKRRTAQWANIEKIKEKYAEAARLSKETGVLHHVDHIIPMQGAKVSGLHVENNLQVITATENMSKHNRFEVEEFNE